MSIGPIAAADAASSNSCFITDAFSMLSHPVSMMVIKPLIITALVVFLLPRALGFGIKGGWALAKFTGNQFMRGFRPGSNGVPKTWEQAAKFVPKVGSTYAFMNPDSQLHGIQTVVSADKKGNLVRLVSQNGRRRNYAMSDFNEALLTQGNRINPATGRVI